MASVTKMEKNKYRVSLCVNRRRATATITAKSEKDANAQAAVLEARFKETGRMDGKTQVERNTLTINELGDKYIEYLTSKANPVAEKTRQNYVNYLRLHILRFFDGRNVSSITTEDIHDFLVWMKSPEARVNKTNKRPYSAATIRGSYEALVCMMALAVRWNYILKSPCDLVDKDDIPKKVAKPVEYYDENQLVVMLNALDAETQAALDKADAMEKMGTYQPLTLQKNRIKALEKQVLIYLAVTTAARRGEILGLTRDDIDGSEKVLHFRHSVLYTPEGGVYIEDFLKTQDEKSIFLTDDMLKMLSNYVEQLDKLFELAEGSIPYTNRLFVSLKNGKICQCGGIPFPDAYSEWFANFIKRTELPRITFHKLRHSSISFLLNNGVDPFVVAKIAGHSTLEQINKTYGHVYDRSQKEAVGNFIMLSKEYRDRAAGYGLPSRCGIVI